MAGLVGGPRALCWGCCGGMAGAEVCMGQGGPGVIYPEGSLPRGFPGRTAEVELGVSQDVLGCSVQGAPADEVRCWLGFLKYSALEMP